MSTLPLHDARPPRPRGGDAFRLRAAAASAAPRARSACRRALTDWAAAAKDGSATAQASRCIASRRALRCTACIARNSAVEMAIMIVATAVSAGVMLSRSPENISRGNVR